MTTIGTRLRRLLNPLIGDGVDRSGYTATHTTWPANTRPDDLTLAELETALDTIPDTEEARP